MNYSKKELEIISNKVLSECPKECFDINEVLDIEMFIEVYLRLNLEYKGLIGNEIAILIVEGIRFTFIEEKSENESKVDLMKVPGRTIVINENAIINTNEGGRRFSLAHEASHWILHREYSEEYIKENNLEKIIEMEANFLAAELLMPKVAFAKRLDELRNQSIANQSDMLAKEFMVSKVAVNIRIRSIMDKNINNNLTQKCEKKEGDNLMVKKSSAAKVTRKSVCNQQLSYKIDKKFLEINMVYENTIDTKVSKFYDEVYEIAKKNGIAGWKLNNLVNIPNKLAQINPHHCVFFNEEKTAFYSLKKLSNGDLSRINYNIASQIKMFKSGNKEIFLSSKFDKISELGPLKSSEISLSVIFKMDDNKTYQIINAKILSNITTKPFEYYLEKEDVNTPKIFKLCYNATQGLEVMTDVVKTPEGRVAWAIQPSLVKYNGTLYFEPKIIFRVFIDSLAENLNLGTQFRSESGRSKDVSRTIYINQGDKYITARVKKDINNDKILRNHYNDYLVFKEIEDVFGISIEDIRKAFVEGINKENILLTYHTSMDDMQKMRAKAGVASTDKISIKNHILKTNIELIPMGDIPAVIVKDSVISSIKTSAVKQISFSPSKAIAKIDCEEIDLYTFRSSIFKENIYEYVIKFFDKNSKETEICKLEDNKYLLKFSNKEIILNVKDVINDDIVGRKTSEDESIEARKELIGKTIKNSKGKVMAFIEVEDLRRNKGNTKFDSKLIIRNAMNEIGLLNQFIIGKRDESELPENQSTGFYAKVANSILDLFNDLGIVNGYSDLKGKKVYSFMSYKLGEKKETSLPFIIKSSNENIKFMILEGPEGYLYKWIDISNKNKVLADIKSWLKTSNELEISREKTTARDIVELINEDEDENEDEKIVILSHANGFNNSELRDIFESFENASIVETSIVKTELVQVHNIKRHPGITRCIYKLFEHCYRSQGEKVIGMEQKSDRYKLDWLSKSYKHRNLMEIEIIKSQIDEDILAEIIHRLRVPLTTDIHCNEDFLTEHLISFKEYLK